MFVCGNSKQIAGAQIHAKALVKLVLLKISQKQNKTRQEKLQVAPVAPVTPPSSSLTLNDIIEEICQRGNLTLAGTLSQPEQRCRESASGEICAEEILPHSHSHHTYVGQARLARDERTISSREQPVQSGIEAKE